MQIVKRPYDKQNKSHEINKQNYKHSTCSKRLHLFKSRVFFLNSTPSCKKTRITLNMKRLKHKSLHS